MLRRVSGEQYDNRNLQTNRRHASSTTPSRMEGSARLSTAEQFIPAGMEDPGIIPRPAVQSAQTNRPVDAEILAAPVLSGQTQTAAACVPGPVGSAIICSPCVLNADPVSHREHIGDIASEKVSPTELAKDTDETIYLDFSDEPAGIDKDNSLSIQWLTSQYWNNWWNGLTREEKFAIEAYTAYKHLPLNRHLRFGEEITDEEKEILKNLKSAVGKGNCPDNIHVWRRFVDNNLASRLDTYGSEALKGYIIEDPGFQSTSLLPENFMGFRECIIAKLKIPKETRAVSTFEGSFKTDQRELLLQEGTKWKITEIHKKTGKEIYMEAEVVT